MSHLDAPTATEPDLLRIQEVAAETGLTTRTIRYYEELGLLEPAARSEGSYRLFDPDDLVRARNRSRFRSTTDQAERRAILEDALGRVDRQVATLRTKRDRLEAMIAEAHARREHLESHLAEIDAGLEPAAHTHDGSRR